MPRTLRIVHCFRSPVGGIFRHVRDLTDAQAAAGHSVGIICDSTTGGVYEDRLFDAMHDKLALGVHRTPMQRHLGLGDIAAAMRTYGLIRRLKPDILHGHGAKGGAYARLFGTLQRLAAPRPGRFYSPHGGSLHYDGRTTAGKFFFTLERMMDRLTDHIIFVSDYERRTFLGEIGEPRAHSSLVYNGLGPHEFGPVAPADDAADFLFIGMMRDLKGPDIFINALAEARARLGRPLTAVMVGAGPDRDKYQRQVERLKLCGQVRFLEPMPARHAFSLARLVVVPSRAEAMPYIVLEALAAGMPMIATAVGGIPEIFGANSSALVRPDADELAERMAFAVCDPGRFHALMPTEADLRARFGGDVMAHAIERAYFAALQTSA
ncbi:MAG: glycosyltransferase [Hyphomicrobiales bacterium]|nr:glycosyltransferase [Hyphomicrobiales bacterium]